MGKIKVKHFYQEIITAFKNFLRIESIPFTENHTPITVYMHRNVKK